MEKSQAVDYTSIDYLEGLEADPQSVSAGSDILAEAARYHVDLDTLETVGSSAAAPLQPGRPSGLCSRCGRSCRKHSGKPFS